MTDGKDWFIVNVTSGKEAACCAILARLNQGEAWYPTRKVERRPHAKVKRAADKRPRIVKRAWVPGYVFVHADAVECHVINGPHGRVHMRVISPGGVPYRVTDAEMAHMADVPQRVRHMVEQAREAERAAWEAVRPVKGQPAKITAGPFAGCVGIVREVREDHVQIEAGLIPVWVMAESAERVASAA